MHNKVRRYLNIGLDVKINYTCACNTKIDASKSHHFNEPKRKKVMDSKLKDASKSHNLNQPERKNKQ